MVFISPKGNFPKAACGAGYHLPKAGDRPSPCNAASGELMRCRERW